MSKQNQKQIPVSIMEEPKKKELKWRKLPTGLYSIFFEGGGELPAILVGGYTSIHQVEKAISNYERNR